MRVCVEVRYWTRNRAGCELLDHLGIADIDPQNLIAMRRCDLVEHFERALAELNPDGELSQMDRLRELAISVGAVAMNGAGGRITERS